MAGETAQLTAKTEYGNVIEMRNEFSNYLVLSFGFMLRFLSRYEYVCVRVQFFFSFVLTLVSLSFISAFFTFPNDNCGSHGFFNILFRFCCRNKTSNSVLSFSICVCVLSTSGIRPIFGFVLCYGIFIANGYIDFVCRSLSLARNGLKSQCMLPMWSVAWREKSEKIKRVQLKVK